MTEQPAQGNPIPFKAETQQLLNILIHSLYTEREIFLRELISNASDALSRMNYILLTQREVQNPDLELKITIQANQETGELVVEDTGVGMTTEELIDNLGTIAHSGAKAFVEAAQSSEGNLTDIIGQFGVGFYSAFMVAERISVTSRSYHPDAASAFWEATGEDTYQLGEGDRVQRGTTVRILLKEDAREFLDDNRLRQIIKRHSDFIPYPIYLGGEEEPINRQIALWRQNPREVEVDAYHEFYKQLTLDFTDPVTYDHMVTDAPVQMFSLLYVPQDPQNLVFSPRKEPGLKLYARKVLIREFSTELLPSYLNFMQGVVDSEDLPLNVSRESIQSNRSLTTLARLVTNQALVMLEKLGKEKPEQYNQFWVTYGARLKEGVAVEQDDTEKLLPLLRFHTDQDLQGWSGLADVVGRSKPDQENLYYFLGDDPGSVRFSPHMEAFREAGIEVLVLTDPVDAFMLLRMKAFDGHPLVNVADADLPASADKPEKTEGETEIPQEMEAFISRVKTALGDKVSAVRTTQRLSASPARLVNPEGAPDESVQRVYQMMDRHIELPKKVLELNPHHPIVQDLVGLPEDDPRFELVVQQLFENALLVEGLHPDPASMVARIQDLMLRALGDESNTIS